MLSVSVMHSASLSGSSHLVYPCGRGRMTLVQLTLSILWSQLLALSLL